MGAVWLNSPMSVVEAVAIDLTETFDWSVFDLTGKFDWSVFDLTGEVPLTASISVVVVMT